MPAQYERMLSHSSAALWESWESKGSGCVTPVPYQERRCKQPDPIDSECTLAFRTYAAGAAAAAPSDLQRWHCCLQAQPSYWSPFRILPPLYLRGVRILTHRRACLRTGGSRRPTDSHFPRRLACVLLPTDPHRQDTADYTQPERRYLVDGIRGC
jgi:hypothetical protein